jgi:hypothetical protein
MSKTTKWIIGTLVALVILQFAMPFVWQLIYPATNAYGYGMPMTLAPDASAGVRGFGMPMMGGYGMHLGGFGYFGSLFMWLLPLGTLILIALGIAYLWKKLTEKPQ